MIHPFISVVIPVYNAEKYLEHCVQSILAQTYDAFEIILVNDGSRDSSGAICDELASQHSGIRVIHKENGGAADSRNRGVQEARGNYIAFVDADDYIAPDYLSYLVELLNAYDVPISVCDSYWTDSQNVDFSNQVEQKTILMDGREAALSVINENGLKMLVPWGKLLPAHLVRMYPFPRGRKAEDEATLYKILYESGGCVLSFRKLYGYYQNAASLMHNVDEKQRLDKLITSRERYEFFAARNEKKLAITMHGYYVNQMIAQAVAGYTEGLEDLRNLNGWQYLCSGIRPLYMANYIYYRLFGGELLALIDKVRKKQ